MSGARCILVIAALVLVFACASRPRPNEKSASASARVRSVQAVPASDLVDPFPQAEGDERELSSDVSFGRVLRAAREPSFARAAREHIDGIRLTWVRTWHTSFSVRVMEGADGGTLIAHEVSDLEAGREHLPKLLRTKTGHVDPAQRAALREAVDRADFWHLPSTGPAGKDGTWCLVEVSRGGRVYEVERYAGNEIAEVSMMLMRLSGFEFSAQ